MEVVTQASDQLDPGLVEFAFDGGGDGPVHGPVIVGGGSRSANEVDGLAADGLYAIHGFRIAHDAFVVCQNSGQNFVGFADICVSSDVEVSLMR